MEIAGNEAADRLANAGALEPQRDHGRASKPTASGVWSQARKEMREAAREWWEERQRKLSRRYKDWDLPYDPCREPEELSLPRPILHRYLAIRHGHGDFAWYHEKFKHADAKLDCSCGRRKAPEHLVYCRRTRATFENWPRKRKIVPRSERERINYLRILMSSPKDFQRYLEVTGFYSDTCTR